MMKKALQILTLLFLANHAIGQSFWVEGKVVDEKNKQVVKEAIILVYPEGEMITINQTGKYRIQLPKGNHTLEATSGSHETEFVNFELTRDTVINFNLAPISYDLTTVDIKVRKVTNGVGRLEAVEDMGIYESKKNEVIVLDDFAANKATNNSRQIFAKVPGLNIWESDFAGLQLDIAARGLGPSRTANFNTRQNGYDMSADALGYPESYYMPAMQAVEKIEIVRGAASLQYGPQFGGMLNFRLKEVRDKPFEANVSQSVGSFGFLNTFTSVGGTKGKWDYYSYYQYRQGEGWRENSGFNAHTAFGKVGYQVTKKLKLGFEYSYLNYVAQQPGGLTDGLFREGDATVSLRNRNWFEVNWNLMASNIDYQFNPTTKLNIRTFGLVSSRNALGNLSQIGILDNPRENRTLISDVFTNVGSEARLLKEYSIKGKSSAVVVGMRYYRGLTNRKQGFANADSTPDFKLLNPNDPEEFDYRFPSQNQVLFAENLIYITEDLSLTLGGRLERIQTDAIGTWRLNRYDFAGNLLSSQKNYDEKSNTRWVPLYGIGSSYYFSDNLQTYANFSRNFRSITFSDLRVVNPNFQLDSLITDENGFNIDLGFRGKPTKWMNFDISAYLLRYNNRIGQYELPGSTTLFKTNIGDSRHIGTECFAEVDLLNMIRKEYKPSKLIFFVNYSYTNALYVNSDIRAIQGKRVEYVPNHMLRMGLNLKWKDFKATYQFSYLGDQFSDATNSEFNPNALTGVVPSYYVMDLSLEYTYKIFKFSTGVNNLTNQLYFTRRAESYPGPGIIPATPRSYYFSLNIMLDKDIKKAFKQSDKI